MEYILRAMVRAGMWQSVQMVSNNTLQHIRVFVFLVAGFRVSLEASAGAVDASAVPRSD